MTSEYNLPHFTDSEFIRAHSLITKNHLLLINDGTNPELWLSIENINRGAEMPLPGHKQKIYSEKADYVINVGDIFIHPIKKDTTKTFLHFTEEFLPKGMGFNLGNIQLEWTPTISQLGFHEFSYMLELRERIGLEMETENDLKFLHKLDNKNSRIQMECVLAYYRYSAIIFISSYESPICVLSLIKLNI